MGNRLPAGGDWNGGNIALLPWLPQNSKGRTSTVPKKHSPATHNHTTIRGATRTSTQHKGSHARHARVPPPSCLAPHHIYLLHITRAHTRWPARHATEHVTRHVSHTSSSTRALLEKKPHDGRAPARLPGAARVNRPGAPRAVGGGRARRPWPLAAFASREPRERRCYYRRYVAACPREGGSLRHHNFRLFSIDGTSGNREMPRMIYVPTANPPRWSTNS